MGRPLPSRFFGANADNNFKVQFYNGSASVPGYIVKQYGSERFKCRDADGNTAICRMVAKASGDLGEGEMSMTVKYDDGTSGQLTKIARYTATVNGSRQIWSFNNSTTDTKVQFEEAGSDEQMTGADDFEGDEVQIPTGMDRNEPLPGSGGGNNTVPGTFAAISSVVGNFSAGGITFRDITASGVASVPNSANGLYRRKYVGNFSTTYVHQTTPAYTLDMSFFGNRAHGPISEPAHEVDTYLSFGMRTDLGYENNYAFEWKGYMQAPVTGNMRIGSIVDDDAVVWIGAPALNPTNSNYLYAQSGNANRNGTDGITVEAGKWYPIRIWFQEWGGAELFQLGASNSVNSTKYGMGAGGTPFTLAYNTATKGY
jgi:hypothetical protein